MSKLKVRRSRVVVAGAGVFLSAATFFGIVVFRHDVARSPASAVVVRVTVYFPGMSAQDIERDITVPLEDQVTQVQGVGKVESVTSEGRSTVSCEFRPGADGLGAAEKVRSKVRRVQVAAGAEAPVVASRSDSESIISYVVQHATLPLSELRILHDETLKASISAIPGVERVTLCGVGVPEVRVNLDPMRLAASQIYAHQVAESLQAFLARGDSSDGVSEGLRGQVFAARDGSWVRLSDVAALQIGTALHGCACVKDGKPALCVVVRGTEELAKPGAVRDAIHSRIMTWESSAPAGVVVRTYVDDADHRLSLMLWSSGEATANAEVAAARDAAVAVAKLPGVREVAVRLAATRWNDDDPWSSAGGMDVVVETVDAHERQALEASLASAVERAVPWLRVSPPVRPNGTCAEVWVTGPEVAELAGIARQLLDRLAGVPGVRKVVVAGLGQRASVQVLPDNDKSAALGVSAQDVAWMSALVGGGILLGPTAHSSSAAPIRLQLAGVGSTPEALASLLVPSKSSRPVRLAEVADVRWRSSPDPIFRRDRVRSVLLHVWGSAESNSEWRDGAAVALRGVTYPPGYSAAIP